MATIYDVAKKAKVSSATVSRVVNGGSASPKTKAVVSKAIESLGYVPDIRAVSLKGSSAKKIGIIVPDITDPIYPEGIKEIHGVLKAKGYSLILGNTYGKISEERDILAVMHRERVSGLILHTCSGEDDSVLFPILKGMIKNNISMVFVGKNVGTLPVDVVSVDNFDGMFKATDYLIRIGRKRIGFVCGNDALYAVQQRRAGSMRALESRGREVDQGLIACVPQTGTDMEFGEKWADVLIGRHKADALVCGSDMIALGAMELCDKKGLKVPDDVSIAGFGDVLLASLCKPKLTTVRQHLDRISKVVCELLLGRINGTLTEEPKNVLVTPELIVRGSA